MFKLFGDHVPVVKGLIKNTMVFLPLVFVLVLVNYFVDPAQLFKGTLYEKGIVDILHQGLNVAGITNYDERILQKFYIETQPAKNEVVVFGSSRAMQIAAPSFPNQTFFNHSVSGATLQDYMAIYEMLEEKGDSPDVVVLGLDPWLLNSNSGQTRWKSVRDHYEKSAVRLGVAEERDKRWETSEYFLVEKYAEIFSLSYFQSAIRYLWKRGLTNIHEQKLYYGTDRTDLNIGMIHADGSRGYGPKIRNVNVSEALEEAKKYVRMDPVYSLNKFRVLDQKAKTRLEAFVRYLLENDIKVVFFLSPYHPYVYRHLVGSHQYKIILASEKFFRDVALKNRISIVGSYSPEACELEEKDFYDGMHPKAQAISRMAESIEPQIFQSKK
ncbi:MAG: DUF1574 family protein [Candidatus Lindowbacteria bacterium]|nr:DUF1574 family protein [Candidatus Lindowbacteria bacterium]